MILLKEDSVQSKSWRLRCDCCYVGSHHSFPSPPALLQRFVMTSSRVGISTAAMAVRCTKSVWVCTACVFIVYYNSHTRCSALFFTGLTSEDGEEARNSVCVLLRQTTQLKFNVSVARVLKRIFTEFFLRNKMFYEMSVGTVSRWFSSILIVTNMLFV